MKAKKKRVGRGDYRPNRTMKGEKGGEKGKRRKEEKRKRGKEDVACCDTSRLVNGAVAYTQAEIGTEAGTETQT